MGCSLRMNRILAFLVPPLTKEARMSRHPHKKRKWAIALPCLVVAAMVLCVAGWAFRESSLTDIFRRQKFVALAWRNQQAEQYDELWPPRLCMVNDLISSGILDGMPLPELIRLLGPPDDQKFPFANDQKHVRYYLGPERGFFRIDSEWLFISLDGEERVQRYWIYRD